MMYEEVHFPFSVFHFQFVWLGVTNVVSRQRYPWNGLVDIDCEITCSNAKTNINLYLSAKDNAANRSLAMRHVWLEGDATHTNALEVKAGKHRLVWDAGADAPNTVSGDVTIDVQALVGTGAYLVIDLSGGPSAASYPVSYLGAEPQGGWTDEYKTEKLVLRMIQPGTFTMGSPSGEVGRYSYEDQHTVTLTKSFYMGVFEVTQRQWELVMGTKPSYFSNASYYQTRPVEQVSYNQIRGSSLGAKWPASNEVDATSFIGKIRAKTGLEEFDLPTEAQWEYACRAGTTTALNSGKNLTNTSSDANMNEVGTGITVVQVTVRRVPRHTERQRLAPISRTSGDSTTCTAMCGSGVWTGGRRVCLLQPILLGRPRVRTGSSAAGVGATTRTAVVLRAATATTTRRIATTIWASASPGSCHDKPKTLRLAR